ncbi:MAG TPA: glucose 1-dehydrogenase [Anaerolineae bacterium]|nr:glucose 1-dehydrogenase [Anaerolineae bacterium]HIQ05574.1 glucose 1-dehydrogenase [Anaerolineae bacterium]
MQRLEDKIAIVTGGGRGIGRGIAQVLSQEGASVVVADLREDLARETVDGLSGPGLALRVDVTSLDDLEAMVAHTVDRFGRLDVLVNNAGVVGMAAAVDLDPAEWDRVLAVNTKALFFACQVAARQMIKQGSGGKIVNIASNAGRLGFPDQPHYAASKGAVISLTRALAMEWIRDGIYVNAVAPGGVGTELFAEAVSWTAQRAGVSFAEMRDRWVAPVPLGRLIEPQEIGRVVAFLASSDADIIVGQTINADGGMTP